jgi:hypothetical protein
MKFINSSAILSFLICNIAIVNSKITDSLEGHSNFNKNVVECDIQKIHPKILANYNYKNDKKLGYLTFSISADTTINIGEICYSWQLLPVEDKSIGKY